MTVEITARADTRLTLFVPERNSAEETLMTPDERAHWTRRASSSATESGKRDAFDGAGAPLGRDSDGK